MFELKELRYIKDAIEYSETQDKTGLEIVSKINNQLKELDGYNLNLYRFYWDCGRQGDVEGVFKATKEEVKDLVGRYIYFGEILGKHSEVYGNIKNGDIKLISNNPFTVINSTESGYNPLNYIRYDCEECGNSYDIDEFDSMEDALNGICSYCKHKDEEESEQ